MPHGACVYDRFARPPQRSLSSKFDAQVFTGFIDRSTRAHFLACQLGATARLTALPGSPKTHIKHHRSKSASADGSACKCGSATHPAHSVEYSSSAAGDHALACCCGGDRVIRHNAIRDVLFAAASLFMTSCSSQESRLVDGFRIPVQTRLLIARRQSHHCTAHQLHP